jgi:hypothetical protein
MNLYPPILESQRISCPAGTYGAPGATSFAIAFTMPLATDLAEIQHVQVLIRRQVNMESWCNQTRSVTTPDREVIYLDRTAIQNINGTPPGEGGGLFYLLVPISALRGSFPAGADNEGETFTIQIRFGADSITYTSVTGFATWKQAQISSSAFGEWSNTQRMFVYADSASIFNTTVEPSPIAGISWSYNAISIDPLAQVRIQYSWSTPDDDSYGNMFRSQNLDFESHDGMGAMAAGSFDMGIMRFSPVNVVLTLTTINNTIFQKIFTIPGFFSAATPQAAGGFISPINIMGEEIDDGVLAIEFGWNQPTGAANRNFYHNIYRVNLRTLETILITQIPPQSTFPKVTFEAILKDYSVEMGEEYVFFGAAFNLAHPNAFQYALVWDGNLTPGTWKPHLYPGYARQMNFQGNTFLTTKWGQLRLQGNVNVSSFKRNTSDQFTTTIGGAYPFYSRSAQFNYRTLSLQGLVTMNFDPTNTFLRFRTQLASPGMVQAAQGAAQRYEDGLAVINPADPERNMKVDALLNQYYRDMEIIYRGINPATGDNFMDLTDRPLWMTGQLWLRRDQDNEKLILRDTELFSDFQFSNSAVRTRDRIDAENEAIKRNDGYDGERIRGPLSRYSERLVRDATPVYKSDRNSDLIYAERKFREAVMEWLSDGKPKLFRSETEGNMIVMLSDISFSPFNKSRMVYSLSCTITEIAEYNLTNLVMYGLIPVKFESFFPNNNPYEVIYGEPETFTTIPNWNSTTTYRRGSCVRYTGRRFQARNNVPVNNPPPNTQLSNSYWQLF